MKDENKDETRRGKIIRNDEGQVREHLDVAVLIAVGVNAEGYREVLAVAEDEVQLCDQRGQERPHGADFPSMQIEGGGVLAYFVVDVFRRVAAVLERIGGRVLLWYGVL